MANYQLKLTPTLVNRATEGSMDTSVVNGVSIQRTGYLEVVVNDDRKIVELADGGLFDDSFDGIGDFPNVEVIESD